MKTRVLSLLGILLVAASPAMAVDLPAKWLRCHSDADCVEVSSTCGISHAVNHRYEQKAHTTICAVENCVAPGCDGSSPHAWSVKCNQGQCIPDFEAKMPEQQMRFELKDVHMECPKDNPNCGLKRQ